MKIIRGSLGLLERYEDVIDYAAKKIPGFHGRAISDNLVHMNKLFRTDYNEGDLIETSMQCWQALLPVKESQSEPK